MKKKWKEPKLVVQHFVPNEYVSACGTLDNGTVLYAANIEIVTAWERIPAGIEHYIQDDMLSNPHKIYMPTHMLENPDQYITKVGHFLRKTSLDELPQLFNILVGDMAVIGPRPALWNQFDLIEERDKYGANDVRPGLTGWAQIHGRDELEIDVKAKLDGYYVQHMSFWMDVKCFFGTIASVIRSDGVVEGGTGTIHAKEKQDGKK